LVIVNEFSVALSLHVDEVLPILSDLQLHLGLWPIIESLIEVLSGGEVLANLRIGDYSSKARFRLSTNREGEVVIIVIEGRDDLSLELRLSVVGRELLGKLLTIVRGRVSVKSANEKALKPRVKEFIESYTNRLIEELPAVIEAWKKGLVKRAGVAQPATEVVPVEQVKREELPKPSAEVVKVGLAENPAALEDEVLLSKIILKSRTLNEVREELGGPELLTRLSKECAEAKLKTLYALAADAEGNKVRVLIKDGVIVGVRIELREGAVINGAEALRRLSELGKRMWRITTYSLPEELTR